MSAGQGAVAAAINSTAELLFEAAKLKQLTVSGDRRVTEVDAAKLLGYSHGNLKALRQAGNGPAFYALGMNGARISYRLHDLAAWIEMARGSLSR